MAPDLPEAARVTCFSRVAILLSAARTVGACQSNNATGGSVVGALAGTAVGAAVDGEHAGERLVEPLVPMVPEFITGENRMIPNQPGSCAGITGGNTNPRPPSLQANVSAPVGSRVVLMEEANAIGLDRFSSALMTRENWTPHQVYEALHPIGFVDSDGHRNGAVRSEWIRYGTHAGYVDTYEDVDHQSLSGRASVLASYCGEPQTLEYTLQRI